MTIDRYGIHFGLVSLTFYGMLLVTGAFCGGFLATREVRRRGLNPELVWDGLIWVLVAGIIGARVWHVLTPPPSMVAQGWTTQYYLDHPLDALNTTRGGLGIPGAVMGGMLGLFLFTRFKKLGFGQWVDIVAAPLALGQAIGRWGNFVNQELYGAPTTLPWGLNIDALHRLPGYTDPALRFHPLFLYESLGNLAICGALLYIARHYSDRLKPGDLFLLYLIFYPVERFLLEFLRLDSARVFDLNANQTLMFLVAVSAGLALLTRRRKLRRHEIKTETEEIAAAPHD